MTHYSHRAFVSETTLFAAFAIGYVALFVGVPPLCLSPSCTLEPRPEAFLLPMSLAFGLGAILGVATGGMAAIFVYETLNPVGLTPLDAIIAFSVFLVAGLAARELFLKRPDFRGALAATVAITGLVTLVIGSYAIVSRGTPFLAAYTTILGQALVPINVLGFLFLAWAKGTVPRKAKTV